MWVYLYANIFRVGHDYSFLFRQLLCFQNAFVFKVKAVCVLLVALLNLPPAPYRGFCVRLAGRCPAPAAVILLGFCSGLDKHRWAFCCYLLLLYLYSAAVPGLDIKMSSPTQSPTVSGHPMTDPANIEQTDK